MYVCTASAEKIWLYHPEDNYTTISLESIK